MLMSERPEERLPHRAPALLVQEVIRSKDDQIWVRGQIPPSVVPPGWKNAPAVYGIEMAAQASALWPPEPGQPLVPKRGYLVSIRRTSLEPTVPTATPLIVHLTRRGRAGKLNTFYCEVALEAAPEETLVAGEVSTYAEF